MIDLRDVSFGATTSLDYVDDGAGGGMLTVSDGTRSVQLHLLGFTTRATWSLERTGAGALLLTNHSADGLLLPGG